MGRDAVGGGAASLRGRPRGRLSVAGLPVGVAGLPVGVAPALPRGGGDGPWSEASRLLSSDDILKSERENERMNK